MLQHVPALAAWESFYVIVGSSGAALTGLQFVVIALVSETRQRSSLAQIDAFATPTIVHFCAVLFISAVLSAPWHEVTNAAWILGVAGALGVGYIGITTRRARRQKGYKPVFEDWLWHMFLTFVAYATLLAGALTLVNHTESALFAIGGTSVLLLFIGIHNAWDTVTWIAVERMGAPEESAPSTKLPPKRKGRR
jgi:hypothetical protein